MDDNADDCHSDSEDESSISAATQYAFPDINTQIQAAIDTYGGGVFPKLNFSSPKDTAWLLPSSQPLRCTSPADVYMLLKSSDFVVHDLSTDSVFEGCVDVKDGGGGGGDGGDSAEGRNRDNSENGARARADGRLETTTKRQNAYELELVLRKWFAIDPSREMRAFVRDGVLVGISQRDTNYYEFLNEPSTQRKIVSSFVAYWTAHVKPKWTGPPSYTFDVLLTRDLMRFHIIDFNPYAPRTDALLFTYDELAALFAAATASSSAVVPTLRVVDSRGHPAAAHNAPRHQHNMVPLEALTLSEGRSAEEFAAAWMDHVRRGAVGSDDDDDEDG